MSILGLDIGDKRIGYALSDELRLMAHASGLIERKSDETALGEIKRIVTERDVQKIVVGLPKTLKGDTGIQAEKVMKFADTLRVYMNISLDLWDERLTTVQAERALIERDMSRAKRKLKRDAAAAEIMLQSYLDFTNQKEKI